MPWITGGAILGGALLSRGGGGSSPGPPQFPTAVAPLVNQTVGALTNPDGSGAPIQQFEGDRVADLTGFQQQGLAQTPGLSQALQQQAGTAAGGFNTFAGGSQVGQNPFLEQSIQAMRQSANQDFQRNQLPAISNNAIATGGLGGSRQGIAQGVAMGDLNQQLVNTEAGMRQGQFNQDQSNQLQALINQGNILGGQGAAQGALLGAGGIQQQQNQAEIGGEQQLFNEQQTQQHDRDQQLLQILMGAPAAVPQQPNNVNPLAAGLGAGMVANQLFGNNPTNNFIPGSSSTFLPPGVSPTAGGGSPLLSPF